MCRHSGPTIRSLLGYFRVKVHSTCTSASTGVSGFLRAGRLFVSLGAEHRSLWVRRVRRPHSDPRRGSGPSPVPPTFVTTCGVRGPPPLAPRRPLVPRVGSEVPTGTTITPDCPPLLSTDSYRGELGSGTWTGVTSHVDTSPYPCLHEDADTKETCPHPPDTSSTQSYRPRPRLDTEWTRVSVLGDPTCRRRGFVHPGPTGAPFLRYV